MTLSDHIDYVQGRTQDSAAVVSRAEILTWLIDGLRQLLSKSNYNRRIWVENVPPRYAGTITHEWERDSTKDNLYKWTHTHKSGRYECSFIWEVEAGATAPQASNNTLTHLWELAHTHPTEQHFRVALPRGAEKLLALWFDHKRLSPSGVAQLDELEDSHWQIAGEPVVFVTGLSNSRVFDIYEIQTSDAAAYEIEPHTAGLPRGISGDRAYEISSDTEGDYSATGTIRSIRSGDRQYFPSPEWEACGIVRDWRSSSGNLLMIFTEIPRSENFAEDSELPLVPVQIQKYMRYWALYCIHNRPGELFEPNMATHYERRFQRGIRLMRRLGRILNRDESYSRDSMYRSVKRIGKPRLPSNYPRPR